MQLTVVEWMNEWTEFDDRQRNVDFMDRWFGMGNSL